MAKTDLERWQSIENAAVSTLRSMGLSLRRIGSLRPICRLIHFESHQNVRAYFLSERKQPLNGVRYFAIRATWDRVYDTKRFDPVRSIGEPQIHTIHCAVNDEAAQGLILHLNKLNLPMAASSPGFVLDGDLYEFTVGSLPGVTFDFGILPPEWSKLQGVLEILKGLMPQDGQP